MKKFFKGLGLFVLSIFIVLAVAGVTFARVMTPNNMKKWIQQSGAYDGLVDAVISQAQQDNNQEGNNPFKKPEIQAVAKQAITPAFLQSSAENFIDGSYSWLSGATQEPTFNIDVAKVKQDFANGLSTYAVTRYNGLAVCARGQIPDTSDFMNIQCRVEGYDIKPEADKKAQEVVGQIQLPGGGNNVSAQTLKADAEKNGQKVFFANTLFPTIFRINQIFPYAFAGLVALIALIIILVSKPKQKGIRGVGISLIIAGVLLLLMNFGIQTAQNNILASMTASSKPIEMFGQKTVSSIVQSVGAEVRSSYQLFAIILLAVGAAAVAIALMLKNKQTDKAGASKPKLATTEPAQPVAIKAPAKKTPTTPKIQ